MHWVHHSVPRSGTTRGQPRLLFHGKWSSWLPTSPGTTRVLSLESYGHEHVWSNKGLRGTLSRIWGPPGETTLS